MHYAWAKPTHVKEINYKNLIASSVG